MALPFVQSEPQTDEQYLQAQQGLPSTRLEAAGAEFQSAFESNPLQELNYLGRVGAAGRDENQNTLSIDELNKKYPGMSWSEPKKERVAAIMADDHDHKLALQRTVDLGPQDWTQKGLGFGAGTVAGLLDPVTIGSFALGGEAIEGAGLVARGAGIGSAAVNAAAGAAAGQIPLEGVKALTESQRGNDFTLGDVGGDLAQAAAGGVVLHGATALIGKAWSSARAKLSAAEVPQAADVHASSVPAVQDHPAVLDNLKQQAMDGRNPNIKPFEEIHAQERTGPWNDPSGPDNSGRSHYKFEPLKTDEPVSGKFYVGTDSHAEAPGHVDLRDHPNAMPENDFGHGTTMVDDARAANGYAASSFNDAPGIIHEVNLKDANLLSADADIPAEAKSAIEKILTDNSSDPRAKDLLKLLNDESGMSLRDVYERLKEGPHGTLDAVNQSLREAGYDGVHFTQEATDGSTAHNGVTVFPGAEKKLSSGQAIQSDHSLLMGPSEATKSALISSHTDPAAQMFHDPDEREQAKRFDKLVRHADVPRPQTELESELERVRGELTSMNENGYIHPDVKADFESIKTAFDKLGKIGEDLRSMLFDCIGSG